MLDPTDFVWRYGAQSPAWLCRDGTVTMLTMRAANSPLHYSYWVCKARRQVPAGPYHLRGMARGSTESRQCTSRGVAEDGSLTRRTLVRSGSLTRHTPFISVSLVHESLSWLLVLDIVHRVSVSTRAPVRRETVEVAYTDCPTFRSSTSFTGCYHRHLSCPFDVRLRGGRRASTGCVPTRVERSYLARSS